MATVVDPHLPQRPGSTDETSRVRTFDHEPTSVFSRRLPLPRAMAAAPPRLAPAPRARSLPHPRLVRRPPAPPPAPLPPRCAEAPPGAKHRGARSVRALAPDAETLGPVLETAPCPVARPDTEIDPELQFEDVPTEPYEGG
jgi:hypothetical protein